MTFEQIVTSIKKRDFKPVYFLHGTESYFIDAISDLIEEKLLTEGEKAFNQLILYGKDTNHLDVIDQARRYPMMSRYQLVMLKEAQEMRSLKELESYVKSPTPTTVLVICHKHKKLNMNTALGKKLKANAVVFESKPLYDNQVPDWIVKYLKKKKLSISPPAAGIIAEYLGTSLSKIVNELDKLAINLEPGSEVTPKEVEMHIGISKDYNVFELQRAITNRDVLKANRIVQYFAANPKKGPMQVVVSSLYNFFSKVYMLHFLRNLTDQEVLKVLNLRSAWFLKEYRLAARNFNRPKTEQVIGILKDYDLKSKGVGYNNTGKPDGDLLKEMIWKLLH